MCVRLFFRKQKSAVEDSREEPSAAAPVVVQTSSILSGTTVTGNIDSEGDILIEGAVRGSVRARRLTLGHDGLVEGDVSADEVKVGGRVKGPIHARHIHLQEGAEVEGELTADTIAIDTGARLTGAVWQGGQQPPANQYSSITPSSWDSTSSDGLRLTATRPRITDAGR
jgi:cytoskeletal protein CcmA (bactofilin family)